MSKCLGNFLLIVILIVQVMSNASTDMRWRVMESKKDHSSHHVSALGFVKSHKPSPDEVITLNFAAKKNNIDDLLMSISDPSSPNYGKHMTHEEITKLTVNVEAQHAISEYLTKFNISFKTLSGGSYLLAEAPVHVWETALNTEFYEYTSPRSGNLIRTEEYSLPESLADHVQAVFNTVQFPAPLHGGPKVATTGENPDLPYIV